MENVVIDGPVELLLLKVEEAMRRGISKLLNRSIQGFKEKQNESSSLLLGMYLSSQEGFTFLIVE